MDKDQNKSIDNEQEKETKETEISKGARNITFLSNSNVYKPDVSSSLLVGGLITKKKNDKVEKVIFDL